MSLEGGAPELIRGFPSSAGVLAPEILAVSTVAKTPFHTGLACATLADAR